MSKKHRTTVAANDGGTVVEDAVPESATATQRRFRVHLEASTPIAHNGVIVEANSADDAWKAFCQMNSISGSSCTRTIEEV